MDISSTLSRRTADPVPAFDSLSLPTGLAREMRSNHAGETGAVCIYAGMLAVSRDPVVRAFATEHIRTERRHLAFFDAWLPARHHSRLIRLWRIAGWSLGALTALFGRRAVFATVRAVESFVERHYASQIEALADEPSWAALRERLRAFCAEEMAHREDAARRIAGRPGPMNRAWTTVVTTTSAAAAAAARRI